MRGLLAAAAEDEASFLGRARTRFLYATEQPLFTDPGRTSRTYPTKGQLMPVSGPEDLHSTFADAREAMDVDALLELFEPNAIVVLPDGTELTDSDARRAMFTALIESGTEMHGVPRKILIAGDIALTSTTYRVDGSPGEPPSTVETAEVSRRQADGSWRVVIDAPAFSAYTSS